MPYSGTIGREFSGMGGALRSVPAQGFLDLVSESIVSLAIETCFHLTRISTKIINKLYLGGVSYIFLGNNSK